MQQGRKSDDGRQSVETLGVDLRTRVKRLRAREKARRRKCKVKFSLQRRTRLSKRTA